MHLEESEQPTSDLEIPPIRHARLFAGPLPVAAKTRAPDCAVLRL